MHFAIWMKYILCTLFCMSDGMGTSSAGVPKARNRHRLSALREHPLDKSRGVDAKWKETVMSLGMMRANIRP
jgi:hypothetical protein